MTGKELVEMNKKLDIAYSNFCASHHGCKDCCEYEMIPDCKEAFINDIDDVEEYFKEHPVEI